MIKIDNLSKYYASRQVLADVNLNFENGNVYGIVGENGSGKTTLFRCIAGLEKYNGKVSSDFGLLKNHLGFLPTEPYFFAKITGREYIWMICNARKIDPGNIDERNVFDLPLNQYAITYSTGMKKKLALTAILLQENKCFILDEPFNGVDIQSNILISNIIQKLKDLGKTVIISSHIFATLSNTCDEIYVQKEGMFIKKVYKKDFSKLETEMKDIIIGNKIEKLGLTI